MERVNVDGEHPSWSAISPTVKPRGRWPSEHDGDGDNGNPGIGRRRYEFVDREHKLQMVKGRRAITVGTVGKGFANLGDVIRRVRCPIPFARVVEVVIRAAVAMVDSCRLAIYHVRAEIENGSL